MLHGELTRRLSSNAPPEMQPLVGDLRALLLEYQRERLQDDSSRVSAPDKLRALLHNEVAGDEVLVVSNREPYIHATAPGGIEVRRPASGLVAAVEAVMRACSGTWIAHGAGNADRDTVDPHDRVTQEQSYPISISWPDTKPGEDTGVACRSAIRPELGLGPDALLGIGVDRLNYTKGILERFQAVERMLEMYPDMAGKFTFVQIAAPSRSPLDEYQNFDARVRSLVQRINQRFSRGSYLPFVLKAEHHEHEEVNRYYRAADVCMVTSLHDGMNLVAKEFVAARDDERGVLVLSQFTGAAMELHAALIINPYHIEQGAEALHRALLMPAAEQAERMRSMRALVRDFNVYRWAGRMLLDASRLRQRERVRTKIMAHSRNALRRVV